MFPIFAGCRRRWIRAVRRSIACVALVASLCTAPAEAIIRDIEPGVVPKLEAGEALLLLGVDTDVDLDTVRVIRVGANTDMKSLRGLDRGKRMQLLALPAGRYRWSSLELRHAPVRYVAHDDEAFMFEVRPGRINYPGDIIYRSRNETSGTLHFSNRGLAAMDWLQAQHPEVLATYVFEYTGLYPDPFPAFYRNATATATAKAAPDRSLPVPVSGALPITVETLWRPGQLRMLEMNPAGELLAQVLSVQRDDGLRWAVELVDLTTDKTVRLTEQSKPITRLDWAGDHLLVVSLDTHDDADTLIGFDIRHTPEKRSYKVVLLPRIGRLVSISRDEPGRILFQSFIKNGSDPVHKLDLRDNDALQKYHFSDRERLDRGVERALRWFADSAGRLRMAIAYDKDGERLLMHGDDGKFRQVLKLVDDNDFKPIALTADGDRIYGTTERGRGQRDLVEFDPATGQIVRTLFSLPGIDVEAPVFDSAGTLIGASYYHDGLLVSDHFEKADADVAKRLRETFPDKSASVLQRDARSQRFVVAVGGSDEPTKIHLYDRAASQARPISEMQPWLTGLRFAPSHTLHAKSRDGFDVESYLTLPNTANGKSPLIVFPHGGPIGIRDNRFFDPEVQFLASLGYAVLQVNFRGSEGFGTAFRKAGERSYGSAIEDDIDAAIGVALAKYPLDESRMCAMGSSYGGYSALVSSIRWPGRFRCAISMSGVSDRALFFTASDSARSAEVRKLMEERIGNPNTDMDEMLRYSPLYRYRELELPVMLVHGGEDIRVDYEHTRRLVRMLNLHGRPPVLIELKDEAHGIDDDANRKRAWEAIAGFLRTHLGDPLVAR